MGGIFHFAKSFPLIPRDDQLRLRLAEGLGRAGAMFDPAAAPNAARNAGPRFSNRLMD